MTNHTSLTLNALDTLRVRLEHKDAECCRWRELASEWKVACKNMSASLADTEMEAARLCRENEAAASTVDGLRQRLEQVEAERDALAAHVERYRSAYVKLTNTSVVNDDWERLLPTALLDEFDRIDDDSPSTSLARRDARVKAEALEELANSLTLSFDRNIISKNGILEKAADYRQQAEGDES